MPSVDPPSFDLVAEALVAAGQAVITHCGEWIRYSTLDPEEAEYVAVCLPAFAPQIVHRDA